MTLKIPPAIAKIAPDGNLTPRQRRRLFIELVKRRIKPGSGSSIEFLLTRTAETKWPDLRVCLKGIPWVIVGGVATRAFMPEMFTNDFDVLIRQSDIRLVESKLSSAGYRKIIAPRHRAIQYETDTGFIIHLIPSNHSWLDDALSTPAKDAADFPVIPLPYLTLLKLGSNKMQNWADVSRMVGLATEEERNEVRRVIAKYSPEDLDDLESLVFLGKKELESPPPKKTPKRKRKA